MPGGGRLFGDSIAVIEQRELDCFEREVANLHKGGFAPANLFNGLTVASLDLSGVPLTEPTFDLSSLVVSTHLLEPETAVAKGIRLTQL